MPINLGNLPYLRQFEADQLYVRRVGGDSIICSSGNVVGLTIIPDATQSVSLFRILDSSNNIVFRINASGTIINGSYEGKLIATNYGGTGLGEYSKGDLIYYNFDNKFARLPIGPTDYVLTSTGTGPQWSNSLILDEGLTINLQSSLKFGDANGNYFVGFKAPETLSINTTWTLPSSDGTSGQAIITDGVGNLNWASVGGTLASGQVTSGLVGNSAVLSGSIGSGQIGTVHLASGTLQAATLSSGIVTSGYIGNNSVTSGNIASGQIGLEHLASGVLSNFSLSSGIVTSGYVGNAAILSGNIASGQIGNIHLASGTIPDAFVLTSGIITSGFIGNNAVVSGSIVSGSISKFHVGSGELVKGIVAGSNVSVSVDANDVYTINANISGSVALSSLYFSSGLILNSGSFYDGTNTAYAGIASGGIISDLVADYAIISGKIASGQVGRYEIAENSIFSGHISSSQIGDIHITSGGLGSGSIGSGQIGLDHLASGVISNFSLSSGIVTSGYIGDEAVVSGNIGSGQVGAVHLASGTIPDAFTLTSGIITSGYVGNEAVVSGSVASGQIGTYHLASGVLQSAPATLQSGQITSGYLGDNSVVSGSIASGQVSRYHLSDNSIFSGHISSAQVGSIHIASGAIVSGLIGQFAVANINIISGTVANDKLANSTITIAGSSTALGGAWAAAALTTSSGLLAGTYYPSGALTIGIASGGITTEMIANGAVTSGDVGSSSLGGVHIASGSLTGNNLAASTVANVNLVASTITIAGSSTALGGAWSAAALTTSSGLLAGTYYPSGSLTIGIASGGITSQMLADGAVSSGDLAIGAVNNQNIVSGTIANDKLVASTINIAGSSTSLGGSWAAAALTTSSGLLAGTYYPSGALTIGIASGGINSQHIASGAVVSGDIGNGAVISGSIASGQIYAHHFNAIGLSAGYVLSTDANGNLTWAAGGIGSINSGSISRFYLASGAVNSGHIASGAVVTDSIANGQITSTKIASGAIVSGLIGQFAVANINIISGTVANDKLVNSSVTIAGSSTALGGSWAAAALTTSSGLLAGTYYPSGALTIGVASGGIVAQMLGSGSVTSNAIASGSIGAFALASGIVEGLIGSGAITSGDLAIGAVNNQNIVSGTIANDKLANSSVTIAGSTTALGGSWAAAALTTSSGLLAGTYYPSGAFTIGIASGGLTAQMHGSGSVSSGAIGLAAVNNININSGTIANDKLINSSITIAGSSTSLGGAWAAAALTTSSGLLAGTYYPSGALTIGIATAGVVTAMIASGAVGTNQLALGAVNNYNITSGTIANDKLVNSSITIAGSSTALGGAWAAQALTTSSGLLAGTYYPSGALVIGVASGGINSLHIASGAVVSGDIGQFAVANINIISGTVANDKLVNSSITIAGSSTALGASWAAAALTTSSGLLAGTYYPSGALTIGIATAGVVTAMIASGAVGTNQLALGAVNNYNITSGTIANDKLANSTITIAGSSTALGGAWAAAALTTSSGLLAGTYYPSGALVIGVASGGINSQHIASGAVVSGDIGQFAVANINIISGTIANDKLTNSTITIAGSSTSLGGTWAAAALTTSSGLLAGTYYPSGALTIGIATAGVVSAMIASGAVLSGNIASGQIGTNHISSGTAVTNIVSFPATNSGLYYLDFAQNISGSTANFTSSGLVYNPRSGGTLGIGDTTNPTSRLTVNHSTLYPGQSLQLNTATMALFSGSVTSGATTYVNDFQLATNRGSSNLTTYASRIYHYGYVTSGAGGFSNEIGGLKIEMGDTGGSAAPTTIGLKLTASVNSHNQYGVYVDGSSASANVYYYGIYSTATNAAGQGNWGIYAESSNTGGIRPAYGGQFRIAGNVTAFAYGLLVNTASITVGHYYYGAYIDASAVTASSGKIALYVADGTTAATIGNGTVAASFTGGNIGIRTTTPSGTLHVETGSATRIGQIVRGFTSQTANLTEWQDSANNIFARINASGEFFGLLSSGIVRSGSISSGSVGINALNAGAWTTNQVLGQDGAGNLDWVTPIAAVGSGAITSGMLGIAAVSNLNINSGTISNDKLVNSTITIAGSSTSLGGAWAAAALTTSSGLLAGTYYPSGALTIGIATAGVVTAMIASGAVGTNQLALGAVNNYNITSGTVANDKLANSTISIAGSSTALGGSWAAQALTTSSGLLAGTYYPSGSLTIGIASGGIVGQHIASGAITSGKIGNAAVLSGSIASGQIYGHHFNATGLAAGYNLTTDANGNLSWAAGGTASISSGSITRFYLGSGAVNSGHIASGAVVTDSIANGQITSAKIANGAVVSGSIGANVIGSPHILAGSIVNASLANSAISIAGSSTSLGGAWAAAALTTSSGLLAGTYYPSGALTIGIASGGINSQLIADGAITSGEISSGQIGAFHLASGVVSSLASGVAFTVTNFGDNRVLTSVNATTAYAETNLTYDGTTLDINSVASGSSVLNIDGVSGTIFNITDSTVGDLLQVGNISGNAIFSVSSYGYTKNLARTFTGQVATFSVYSFSDTTGSAAFYDYYIQDTSTSAYRAGMINAVWNATADTLEYNELATNDLGGPTSGLAFSLAISSNNVVLSANITAGTWTGRVAARVM